MVENIEIIDFSVDQKAVIKEWILEKGKEHPETGRIYKVNKKFKYPIIISDVRIWFKSDKFIVNDRINFHGIFYIVLSNIGGIVNAVNIDIDNQRFNLQKKGECILIGQLCSEFQEI